MITDDRMKTNVATNVVALLAYKGWSQARLAKMTGETRMKISNICAAKHEAGGATLARIAEAFGVTVDALLADPPGVPEKVSRRVRQTA